MKHFLPHPSQCVENGLNDAIQFSNTRWQYCTSGDCYVKTGAWRPEMSSSSVLLEIMMEIQLEQFFLQQCPASRLLSRRIYSIMQNVLGNDPIEMYLSLHCHTEMFYNVQDDSILAKCPKVWLNKRQRSHYWWAAAQSVSYILLPVVTDQSVKSFYNEFQSHSKLYRQLSYPSLEWLLLIMKPFRAEKMTAH